MKISLLLVLLLLLVSSVFCYEINIGGSMPKGVYSDDLDRDGYVDLVVVTLNYYVRILLNNGDGTYSNPITLPGGKKKSFTQRLYDFNNDGWTDIDGFVALTDSLGNIQVTQRIHINNNGVFDEDVYIDVPPTPHETSYLVHYGDWNGDDYTDILLWDDGVYYLVQNNSGVSFTATGETLAGGGWGGFRDMDSDGFDELLLSSSEGLCVYKYPDLVSPFLILPYYGSFRSVETEDLDHDGDLDIFTSYCDGSTYSRVCIFENTGNYNYQAHNNVYYDYRDMDGVLLRDVTNDQYLDVVNYAYVSPYNPSGFDFPFDLFYFLPVSMPNFPIYEDWSGFDYVDVDNNGFLDFILVWEQGGARIRVYYNDGMGNFSDNPVVANEDPVITPSPAPMIAAYPNPFRQSTTLDLRLSTTGETKLGIYNLRGQLIRSLLHEHRTEGTHQLSWDGRDDNGREQAPGIYFLRLESGGSICRSKLILMR